MAHLGNGATLHVDSLGLREVFYDLAHLFLGIDKPVASDDEPWLRACQFRFLQQIRISLVTGRQTCTCP